ncbi:hypothetical protein [Geoglobus acetivorans]|uniref:Uncharacterized protein n=1 Tax=Geoglobus acetivorans TaxID=565033 RepID=A0ABZ3H4F2_GEOAI|nr:hypothetical protein [Geoglobus acetivorans]
MILLISFAVFYLTVGLLIYLDFINTEKWALTDRKDYVAYFLLIVFFWLIILILTLLDEVRK